MKTNFNEWFMLLPNEIKEANEKHFPRAAKNLFAYLLYLDGIDEGRIKIENKWCFYKDNETIIKEAKIAKQTLMVARRWLSDNGYIFVGKGSKHIEGKRGDATRYFLLKHSIFDNENYVDSKQVDCYEEVDPTSLSNTYEVDPKQVDCYDFELSRLNSNINNNINKNNNIKKENNKNNNIENNIEINKEIENNIENKNNNLNNIENMENYVTIEEFKKFKKDLFKYYQEIINNLQNEINLLKEQNTKIMNDLESLGDSKSKNNNKITSTSNVSVTPTEEAPQTTGNAPSSHSITPKVETIKPIEVSPTEGKTISDEDLHNWCMAFNAKLSKKTEIPTVEEKQDDSKPMSDFEKEIRGKLDSVKTIPTVEENETPVQRAIREFNEGKDKFKILISLNETDQEEFGDYLKATLYSDQQSHFNTSTIKDNTSKVETISEVSEEPTEDNFDEIEKRVEFIERFNMTRYEDCETKDEMNQTYCDINGDIIKDYTLTFEDRSYANKLNQELIIEYKEAM